MMDQQQRHVHDSLTDVSASIIRQTIVPRIILKTVESLLDGVSARIICDPWAGGGRLAATVKEVTKAKQVLLCTNREEFVSVGKKLISSAQWHVGDPIEWLDSLDVSFDVVVCSLPYGGGRTHSISLTTLALETIRLQDNFENLIMVKAALRLNNEGIGLFVVPPSFFFSQRSVLHHFSAFGLSIEAALELPSNTFIPLTSIKAYLIIVRKYPISKMFVGQLSLDSKTNSEVIANLKKGEAGGMLELGRYMEPLSFRGLDHIRLSEWYEKAQKQFGAPAVSLEELSSSINLGRPRSNFEFPHSDNSIFIPLIGLNDVVDSIDNLSLKRQNYAQVVIDPNKSIARFVAQFLNTEFGKKSRDLSKSETIIRKLNKQNLKDIDIFVPDLQTQKKMLEIETRLAGEENTLRSLQSELSELRRDLWSDPRSSVSIIQRINALADQLPGGLRQRAMGSLDRWIETLPFPLASILRSWQATPSQDFKTKYEHLLHFFEATAEFVGIILLSAFKASTELYERHGRKLKEALEKQHLSFDRSTFGTWKLVVEYFGKQTRDLISAENSQGLCSEIFCDSSLVMPRTISSKELISILSTTNKMRNDWPAHGGAVSEEEAKSRNQLLLTELQKMREVFSEAWINTHLIYALHCRPRRGMFENEIALLMGSNSEFLKESRPLNTPLDIERLYLSNKNSNAVVTLLPLVRIGPSPQSAKNACYFFSRMEGNSARFVSFHFADSPELKEQGKEVPDVLRSLVE